MVKHMDYSMEEDIIKRVGDRVKHFVIPSESNGYRSKFLQSNALLFCVILLLVMKIISSVITLNFPQNIFFADITKSTLENFANQTRQADGLKPLAENQKLNQAAQMKAENMVQNNYFDHNSPSGVTPWFWFLQAGYNYKYAGENLAIGFYDSKEVYDAWLNSPSHKANILNPNYTEIGTAVLKGFGQGNTIVVVQEFGSPSPTKTTVTKNNNAQPVAGQPKIPIKNQGASTTVGTGATIKVAVPTPKAGAPIPTANADEKVLSRTTESQNYLKSPTGAIENRPSSELINYVLNNYDELLQNIIYGVSLVVIGILLAIIFFNFNINFKKGMVFRSVLIIVLLTTATLINKEVIISFIPHQIII
jgi:hypothetical protein